MWKMRYFHKRKKRIGTKLQPIDSTHAKEQTQEETENADNQAVDGLSSLSTPDPLFSALLEQEHYLIEILKHIMDDGLPDYRRVCRTWANACRQLPVKLSDMHYTEIQKAHERFPNAAHLSIRSNREGDSLETCFEDISDFRGLKSLKLQFCTSAIDVHRCRFCFESLRNLVSVHLVDRTPYEFPELYSAIRSLTQLTSLFIYKSTTPFDTIDPFTELKKLQNLALTTSLLRNLHGDFMFPLLDCLTHLEILYASRFDYLLGKKALEVATYYAPNLKSFAFRFPLRAVHAYPSDWSPLQEFHKIKILAVTVPEGDDSFFRVLKGLRGLDRLTIHGQVKLRSLIVQEGFRSLTGLRSLTLSEGGVLGQPSLDPYLFQSLHQLTSLIISGMCFGSSLCCLTQLVHLEVVTQHEGTDQLPHSLTHMPRLETVKLATVLGSVVDSHVFSTLENLKSLRLSVLGDVHQDVIASLSSLAELTHFEYQQYSGSTTTPSYISSFALLTNLRSLKISAREEWDWWQCFRHRSFPNLRRLEAPFEELSEEGKRELYRRFPCLHRLVCHKR